MQSHTVFKALYEPILVFGVSQKVLFIELLSCFAFGFISTWLLQLFIELIISLIICLTLTIVLFFSVHSIMSGKFRKYGFYWMEEDKFYKSIPYKKIVYNDKAILP